MARALPLLRRALSLSSSSSAAAAFSSSNAVAPLRSPLDDRLLRLLRSEISYLSDRVPPYQPPRSFKSFAVEDRPGEQWVRLRAARGEEEVKVDATMFDGAASPPPDAPLFQRVESLERGPRLHLSLIVEVSRADDRVLGIICSAWPDDLAVRHVLTLREGSGSGSGGGGGSGGRDFTKLGAGEREAVMKFLKEREVDDELAEFLHEYMANKEKMELLRWLKTVESFVEK